MKTIKSYTLSNGVEMPSIGFGTWQAADGEEAKSSVLAALKAGYRHIDTAAIYENEASVGAAIAASGIDRESLFITTKLWNTARTYDQAMGAFDDSLKKLGLDYVDLYLIHWPNPIQYRDQWEQINAETWRAMEAIYKSGKAKAIGISNFMPHHMDALLKTAEIAPMVNQIYLNPTETQDSVVAYNREHNIITQAYSPLVRGKLMEADVLLKIAQETGKSVAQVILRWALQQGYVPLPKSVTPSRIEENINIFDFELNADQMAAIEILKGTHDGAPNPDTKEF